MRGRVTGVGVGSLTGPPVRWVVGQPGDLTGVPYNLKALPYHLHDREVRKEDYKTIEAGLGGLGVFVPQGRSKGAVVMDRTFWHLVVCFAFWLICFFSHRDIGSAAFRRCLGTGPGSSVSLPRKQHHDFFCPSTSAVALVRPFLKFSRRYSCNC